MKTVTIILAASLMFFPVTGRSFEPESKTNDLIREALNIEDRRDKELKLLKQSADKKDTEDVARRKQMILLIDTQQGEILLQLTRKLHKEGFFDGQDSAIGMLVKMEKSISETEAIIGDLKAENQDIKDLPLALVALKKTRETWKDRAIHEALFLMSVEAGKLRYPDMAFEDSDFAKRLTKKIEGAVETGDTILADPRHVLYFARQVETEMMQESAKQFKNKKAKLPEPSIPKLRTFDPSHSQD